jgi:hypothetical protein
MVDRNLTHFGFAAALVAATFVLFPGMVAPQARAQDLHLLPGTDCSRLLPAEQTECIRTARRLELRRMEEDGSVTAAPDQAGSAMQRSTVPSTSADPFDTRSQGDGIELPSGALDGTSGK